jgi:quinol monooxygenase YgiN
VNQLVFMGGQAVAAVIWGVLGQQAGVRTALLAAAALLAVGSVSVVRWPLYEVQGIDRTPVAYWAEPALALDPEPDSGPVAVTLAYTVPRENTAAFIQAMRFVERSRRRTGAISWDLYRDGEQPNRFVEVWVVPTWEEHLRQHEGRLTGADKEFEDRALALVDGEPEIAHLFPADTRLAVDPEDEPPT